MHAFYLEANEWQDLILTGSEFHHLSKVLRLKEGEQITLLDGKGKEAICLIQTITKKEAKLALCSEKIYPEDTAKITLALGWGKAARRGFMLEKSVELEASALWFWQAERSQFPVPQDIKASWQEQLIAGAKQCHNPYLPELCSVTHGVQELIEKSKNFDHKQLLVESDYAHNAFLSEKELGLSGNTICVIGPEGGFSPKEVELLKNAGFKTYTIGDRILRWETAAVMVLGLHWWNKQQKKH